MKLPVRYYKFYPTRNAPIGYAYDSLDLSAADTALLIVDVYGKGFEKGERNESKLPEIYINDEVIESIARELIPNVKRAAKKAKLKVVYLTNYLSPALNEGNEWRNMSIRTLNVDVLEAWSEPNEVLGHSKILAPEEGEVLIKKQMYSGFFETELDSVLRNSGIKNLVMVGFDSSICLKYTAVDAMVRNYRLVVLRDCIRTSEYPETEAGGWANFMAVRHIETVLGYTSTSEEFISAALKDE